MRRERSRAPACPKATSFNILSARRFGRRSPMLPSPLRLRCSSPSRHPPLRPPPRLRLTWFCMFLPCPFSLPRGETLIQFHLPLADKLSHPCRNFPPRRFFTASRRRTIYNRNPPSRPPFSPSLFPSFFASICLSLSPPPAASSARAKRFVLARREERGARRNPYRL